MVNSRNKGAAFERKIVSLINKYCEDTKRPERVKRNLDQYQQKGGADIYWNNFAIECKIRVKGDNCGYHNWWQQVCTSAGSKYIPLLIFKFNNQPERVMLPAWLYAGYKGYQQNINPNDATLVTTLEDFCNRIDVILENADYV